MSVLEASPEVALAPNHLTEHPPEPVNLLAVIANAALSPDVDVEKMRALLELKERIDENEAKKQFHAAMIAAQDEIKPVVRNRKNEHTGSKYAELEVIERAIRPIYAKHGFVLSFNSKTSEHGSITMSCTCMHRGGYSKEYELTGALDSTGPSGKQNKTGIQAAGSTVSYLRRYLTCMIYNVVLTNEDDDGVGAAERVDHDQVNKILDLMIACGLENQKARPFLDYMGVSDVECILK